MPFANAKPRHATGRDRQQADHHSTFNPSIRADARGPQPLKYGSAARSVKTPPPAIDGSWWICSRAEFTLRRKAKDDPETGGWGKFATLASLSYAPQVFDDKWKKTPSETPPAPTFSRLPEATR